MLRAALYEGKSDMSVGQRAGALPQSVTDLNP